MDRGLSRRSGLLPVGVLSSTLPLLVLYGSATFSTAQLALLQLCCVWAVQLVSLFLKVGEQSPSPLSQPQLQPAQPAAALKLAPVEVEVVQVAQDDGTVATGGAVELERLPTAPKSALHKERLGQPQVLESRITEEDLVKPVRPTPRQVAEHPLYSNAMLDATLRHFLAVLDPSQLAFLTESPDPASLAAPVPLDSWQQMLNAPGCRVALHPTIPHLYSISASYPDIPLRNLWELMIDIKVS